MARIRTVKPEFFTSEDIVLLSPYARLLYIGLWCEADREGRMIWKPRTFKLRYLPADNVNPDELCAELVGSGLVHLYGDGLAYIPGFSKHQHVNPRESASVLPAPSGVGDSTPKKIGKTLRQAVLERDGRCVRCSSVERLEIDKILPADLGGPNVMDNLRVLCRTCLDARPTSGDALAQDLKNDGHTIADLCVKFGIDAPTPELTDRDKIFAYGIPMLTTAGTTDKAARSFLAGKVKEYGAPAVLDALRDAHRAAPLEPLSWLAKRLPIKRGSHSGFDKKDYDNQDF